MRLSPATRNDLMVYKLAHLQNRARQTVSTREFPFDSGLGQESLSSGIHKDLVM